MLVKVLPAIACFSSIMSGRLLRNAISSSPDRNSYTRDFPCNKNWRWVNAVGQVLWLAVAWKRCVLVTSLIRSYVLVSIAVNKLAWAVSFHETVQEGQHPLTGQRAANFRLLANQWAERRLVTQWRHGCRAMRRSLCNVGASNAGRSLCVQIPRVRSYPLPIYWYHSKGNWLRYNFAADSFYIMKLCIRLFVMYCRNCPKDDKFRYSIPILRKLGTA